MSTRLKTCMVLSITVFLLLTAVGVWAHGGQEPQPQGTTPATTTSGNATSTPAASKFNESPMLAKLVSEGKLPPVDKRLPPNPVVIKPINSVGKYGGTLYAFSSNPVYPQVFASEPFIGYEPLLRVDRNHKWGQPNLVQKYEWSADGKELTLYLRKGIKWSDGYPFTADDIMFHFQHEITNKELNPVFPQWLTVDGKPLTATKIDDYTVRINMPAPYPSFLKFISHAWGTQPGEWYGMITAAHHAKLYNPDFIGKAAAEKMAKEKGFDNWVAMYKQMNYSCFGMQTGLNDAPTLTSYVVVSRDSKQVVWQRNPYYWKVDTAGNQLPYIDQIVVSFIGAGQQLLNGKIIGGEADYAVGSLSDMPLYVANKDKAGYQIYMWKSTAVNGYSLNFTSDDPVLRNLFQNINFRRAMSLAIDRNEMNSLLYQGLAEPSAYYPTSISPYYEQKYADMADKYAKYDPKEANSLLDGIGLTKKDADGIRLRPDGKPLEIVFEYSTDTETHDVAKEMELLVGYMKDIGIKLIPKEETFALYQQRVVANKVQMAASDIVDGLEPLFTGHPHSVVPYNYSWIDNWAIKWAHWYSTNGKEGENPPQWVKDLYNDWGVLRTSTSEQDQIAAGRRIFESMAQNLWKIGTTTTPPFMFIAKNDLHNIPKDYLYGDWNEMRVMPLDPPQVYFDDQQPVMNASPLLYENQPQ